MRLVLGLFTVAAAVVSCSSSEGAAPGAAARPSTGASGASGASSGGAAAGRAGQSTRGGDAGRSGNSGAPSAGASAGGVSGNVGAGKGGTAGTLDAVGGAAGRTSDAGAAGADTGGATPCKRGIAANTAPGAAFSPGVAWWYNWSMKGDGSIELVPMMWGKGDVNTALPASARFLLTFNEPNFHAQSNLTAQAAADLWPMVEAKAKAAGVPIVSPGMNFCGPTESCNGTSPYDYLKDFFAACDGCQVDYVAVHWYNCDLPSLKDYLEPGGSLEGFEQFGKPIWLTEFSCDGKASVAEQETYMRAAVAYLEAKSNVFRYAWFSADPIPNAKLIEDDGSPTALGAVYLGLDQPCAP
jgi:hypothetical protein